MTLPIYLVLSNSFSFPSKVLRYCSGNEFNHLSISLDISLNTMYSFGRTELNNFLIGGFIEEGLDSEYLTKFPNTYCEVYELYISESNFSILSNIIDNFKLNKNKYSYNYFGVLISGLRYNYARDYSYYCSQFIFYLLKESNVVDKDLDFYLPYDIKKINDLTLIYRGSLINYKL